MTQKSSYLTAAGIAVGAATMAAAAVWPVAAQPALERTYTVTWVAGFDGPIPSGAQLRFDKDGKFSGFGGCNQLLGTYTVQGDAVALGVPGRTRKMCPGPAIMFENALVAALSRASAGGRVVNDEVVFSDGGDKVVVLK